MPSGRSRMPCIQSIQKWGNRRVNLYWEAHLKPGHQPPDQFVLSLSVRVQTNMTFFNSKMDSFIRSKYESRRWAKEGPPPDDPSTLESSTPADSSTATVPVSEARISPPRSPPITSPSTAPVVTTTTPATASRTQHQLLSAQHKRIPSIPQSTVAASTAIAAAIVGGKVQTTSPTSTAQNDLFTLDFSPASTPATPPAPKKDVKNDILSLFSQTPTATPQSTTSPWSTAKPNSSLFHGPQAAPAPAPSMMGTSGVGMWGADTGWSQPPAGSGLAPNAFAPVPAAMSGANIWGNPASAAPAPAAVSRSLYSNAPVLNRTPQNPLFATQNVWGNPAPAQPTNGGNVDPFSSFGASTSSTPAAKKDDAFGDIWSSFK
jgi:stromal membrane-associated protein